jgi:hypothetical protein
LDGTGATEIYNGQIDAYNPTGNNNLMIRSWYGIGFPSYDNIVRIGMDTRTGNAGFLGTLTAGSVSIPTGNLDLGTGIFYKNGTTAGYNMNINGGIATNSPTMEFFANSSRKMYVGYANTTDTFIYAENGAKLNLGTQGIQRMYIDTDGNVDVNSRELRVSQLNSGQGQVRLKSGNRQQSALFHCNDDWLYFLATDNGDWTSGYNGTRPLRYNLTSGLVVMDNGLTLTGDFNKLGTTAGFYAALAGGNTSRSPSMEFYANSLRRLYIGYADTSDVNIWAENGVNMNFGTNGATRMKITPAGNVEIGENITMGITKLLYLYNISPTNNAGITCEGSGDMVFFTGTAGTATRLRIASSGAATFANTLGVNGNFTANANFTANNSIASINGGNPSAVPSGFMATGSLTLGDVNKNYGGGTGWTSNTAGLMLECADNTEIMVHDAGARVTSLMYYTGANNTITMGRDAGWGVADVVATNNLKGACLVVNGGGTYQAGCIYSDVNWGMLFRAKVVPLNSHFGWYDANGTELMKLNTAGELVLAKDGRGFVQSNGTIIVESYVGGSANAGWYGTRTAHPLCFYTQDSYPLMTITVAGNATQTAGDNSYMKYGPNTTWSSYLVVGASPDRSGASTAQVISTNGNLHLDAGDNLAMYYGYYANSRVTPNPHYFYGNQFEFITVPQNYDAYAQVCVFAGNQMRKSQCMMRQIYREESIAWTGGITMNYAFYKYNAQCPVKISGKYSMYSTYVGIQNVGMRLYSQTSGAYFYYNFRTYQNLTYVQTTYPFEMILTAGDLGAFSTGWFDFYIYGLAGQCQSDGNNQLHVCVEVLPVSDF